MLKIISLCVCVGISPIMCENSGGSTGPSPSFFDIERVHVRNGTESNFYVAYQGSSGGRRMAVLSPSEVTVLRVMLRGNNAIAIHSPSAEVSYQLSAEANRHTLLENYCCPVTTRYFSRSTSLSNLYIDITNSENFISSFYIELDYSE
jgi:hypothetical protein